MIHFDGYKSFCLSAFEKNSQTVLFIVESKNKLVFQNIPDVQDKCYDVPAISNTLELWNHDDLSNEIEKHHLEKKTISLCGGGFL